MTLHRAFTGQQRQPEEDIMNNGVTMNPNDLADYNYVQDHQPRNTFDNSAYNADGWRIRGHPRLVPGS